MGLTNEQLADQLANELINLYGKGIVTEAVDNVVKSTPWPTQYFHRESGRAYRPHTPEEAAAMAAHNPMALLVSGGWGCVAAETIVAGVPIAERCKPGFLSTSFGTAPASQGFLKGRADLYRVVTESGEEVVVTSQHRFLGRTGWSQLAHLSIGDVIAAHDTLNVRGQNGKGGCYQGCCCEDSRQYDGLSSPAELVVLDILQQLHRIVYGSNAHRASSFRPYKRRYLCHALQDAHICFCEERQQPLGGDGYAHQVHQMIRQFLDSSHQLYNGQLSRPLEDRTCLGDTWGEIFQNRSLGYSQRVLEIFQVFLQLLLLHVFHSIGAILLDGLHDDPCCQCGIMEHRHRVERQKPCALKSQGVLQSELYYALQDMFLLFSGGCSHPLLYNSTHWTKIQDIRFEKFGDFYDITVPFWEHYEANGLLHHNSGKSVFGVCKTLDKISLGMSGLMASNDLPQFKKSLWPEFQKWCPWDQVVDGQRYRAPAEWRPGETFTLNFKNGAYLECGGMDNPTSWLGPNINFTYVDEVSRKKDAECLQVCISRARIPGPHGEPPQIYFTTTPSLSEDWMYDYFGPLKCLCKSCRQECEISIQEGAPLICSNCGATSEHLELIDQWADFKYKTQIIRLRTQDNVDAGNISQDYIDNCRMTLTAEEARVYLDAEFGHIRGGQPFLPTIQWWDDCRGDVPPLDKTTPLVIAVDAASGRDIGDSDVFGVLAVSRHPDPAKHKTHVMVRYINGWQAKPGDRIDPRGTELNPGPERELLRLCGWSVGPDGALHNDHNGYNVKCIVCDPAQMNDMVQRFKSHRIAWMREFGQVKERIIADNDFLRLIQERRIVHNGNQLLRRHISNADRKMDLESKKLRITKRHESQKIDLAVCASMASFEVLRLNL